MMENTLMIEPDSREKIHIKEFLFLYWAEKINISKEPGIDQTVFTSYGMQYEYKNELNDEVTIIDPANLKMGLNTVLEPGKFYTQPKLKDFIYYCEKVEAEKIIMFLIKSFQHGRSVRMVFKLSNNSSEDFFEITDKSELDEAKKLYTDFVNRRSEYPPQIVYENAAIWF